MTIANGNFDRADRIVGLSRGHAKGADIAEAWRAGVACGCMRAAATTGQNAMPLLLLAGW